MDWWIITRDTIFILVYLIALTAFLLGNNVAIWAAVVLLTLYIVHILLMKFNHVYEVAIKKSVARSMEIKELKRISEKDISTSIETYTLAQSLLRCCCRSNIQLKTSK